jgi:hypothetical protein
MRTRFVSHTALTVILLVSGTTAFAGEGLVALQTAHPACQEYGSSAVYTNCDNGTVADNRTGLVWVPLRVCRIFQKTLMPAVSKSQVSATAV